MKEQLLQLLKLPAESSNEQVVSAVAELQRNADTQQKLTAREAAVLILA